MENNLYKIKNSIFANNNREITELLSAGLDPNFEGGWPMRLAARYGAYTVVQALLQYGANPHLLSESGASTLQLAVFSDMHWDTDRWSFLLSCYDSSQLADGAAVAIVFHNITALKTILNTGRCNTHIPTTLTGKTVEQLAHGYKLGYLLNTPTTQVERNTPNSSPTLRPTRQGQRNAVTTQFAHRNLSPSVARFFDQTAAQPALTSPRSMVPSSPGTNVI